MLSSDSNSTLFYFPGYYVQLSGSMANSGYVAPANVIPVPTLPIAPGPSQNIQAGTPIVPPSRLQPVPIYDARLSQDANRQVVPIVDNPEVASVESGVSKDITPYVRPHIVYRPRSDPITLNRK